MKNIYILPTDKQIKNVGDLVKDQYGDIHIFTKNDGKEYGKTTTKLNIYITSDEEIKEGDWFIQVNLNKIIKHHSKNGFLLQPQSFDKKIILTTDPELIKDGVQGIDDEFLEWFVKNPLCEEVEVVDLYGYPNVIHTSYKMVIPKEESKQEPKHIPYTGKVWEPPKQETLEEAAEKYAEIYRCPATNDNEYCKHDIISAINFGAKWQQERMYSREDMKLAFTKGHDSARLRGSYKSNGTFEEDWTLWFEQFKK